MAYLERRYRAAAMPQPTEQDAEVVVKPDGDPTKPTTITQEQLDDILGRNGSYTEEFQPHARPVGEQFKAQKAMDLAGTEGTGVAVQPQATEQNAVAVVQPVGNKAGTGSRPYLADWSQGFDTVMFGRPAVEGQEEVKAKDIPITQAIVDYNRWAKENNGEKLDPFTLYPLFTQYNDVTKSIADNKKAEKRKQMEDMFEQLGYLLTNTGNFVGAALGAPAPANAPDSIELTARQRKLREYADAQRKATARDYLTYLRQRDADEREAAMLQEKLKYAQQQAIYLANKDKREDAYNQSRIKKTDADRAAVEALTPERVKTEQGKQGIQQSTIKKNNAYAVKASSGSSSRRSSGGSSRRSSGVPEGYEKVTEKTGDRKNSRTVTYTQKRTGKGKPYGKSKGRGY